MLEAASISIRSRKRPSLTAWQLAQALHGRAAGGVRQAVERLGQQPGGGRLAGAARPGEQVGVHRAPAADRVAQRAYDMLLTDDLVPGAWPPAKVQRLGHEGGLVQAVYQTPVGRATRVAQKPPPDRRQGGRAPGGRSAESFSGLW